MPIDEHSATLPAGTQAPERQMVGARYELLGLLGSGGMGNVYKARDVELDELVALKVLKPELAFAPGALERFRREVKLARRVTHPNVARVFDIGEHAGDRILTMELVDGESLAARLERTGRFGNSRAVEIARAICAGVGAAHASGVVHRDLKPDNVMLAKDGRVVVTDFGIARAAAEGSRTVGVVGTPAYMAPEQIDERATIDHRADVYAFGAMLYEMLVGEPAWKADSLWALAAARLLNPPPDPRAKQPDLPAELAELVLACMARDPAMRVSSMDEIDRALSRLALPTSTTPTPQTLPAGLAMAAHEKRVAVLPFANLGPADQEYVADGLTEDLIDVLSVARGLRVRSRGMVMGYKGSARDPREVGRELDVQAVVEGSVRRSSGGFRVNARVISVADGFQLWARRFDVPESELLTQNDAIAQAVADALTVKLAAPERSAADPRAVDLYLQARAAYHGSFSGDSARARQLFDELLALTPDDPRALAGRAMTGAHQPFWDEAGRRVVFETAERAIALAPTLPDGYVAKACALVFEGEYVAAIAAGQQAVALAPEDAAARDVLGRILAEAHHEDAGLHLEAAIALEPRFEFPYIALLTHYHHRGEHERVEALLESLRARNPRLSPLIEARLVFWRRDAARGAALLATLDTRHPQEQLARGWLELLVHGPSSPEPSFGLPPAPPGAAIPAFLRRFAGETEVDIACFVGDLPRAHAALRLLDEDGSFDVAWLDHCPLLAELRALPEVAPIRARFEERAGRVIAQYLTG